MHTKITAINYQGKRMYCVLSKDKDYGYQLEEMMSFGHSHGIAVCLEGERINIVDYYHAENMAEYKLLSMEDTDEPLSTRWEFIEE